LIEQLKYSGRIVDITLFPFIYPLKSLKAIIGTGTGHGVAYTLFKRFPVNDRCNGIVAGKTGTEKYTNVFQRFG
jgi:hypothetical protein